MKSLYTEFINKYEKFNHTEKVVEDSGSLAYYMPYYGIFKPEKTFTKLRVMFNASSLNTPGRSLNDILLAEEVKEDVFELIVRLRKHEIALIADIKQMFRQILVNPAQRNLLRMLWKEDSNDSTIAFKMSTVTYGTKCAPFLANRTLKQLAIDEISKYPSASEVTLSDVYLDDIVTGSPDCKSSVELKTQLIETFGICGMTLHK